MRALFIIGLLILILGVASLFVPFPRRESHGVRLGDASVGVTTETKEKVSPIISVVMIAGGIGMMVAGGRSRA